MDLIGDAGEQGVLALLQHQQEILFGFLVIKVDGELVEQLAQPFRMHVLYSRIQHQGGQVVHHLCLLAEVQVGLQAFQFEFLEVLLLLPLVRPHGIDHFLRNLNGRGIGLGIAP